MTATKPTAERLAADATALEFDRVSLALKRPLALPSTLRPAELPLAVLLELEGESHRSPNRQTHLAQPRLPQQPLHPRGVMPGHPGRRDHPFILHGHGLAARVRALVRAIREGDDAMVEDAVVRLSRSRRWLAPLALVVGAFVMLFDGLRLVFSNWRLTVIQILPATWIWLAMLDLKLHVLRGRSFHVIRGPILIPLVILGAAITAASFFLNAVFAFAIAGEGPADIRRGVDTARSRLGVVLAWGGGIARVRHADRHALGAADVSSGKSLLAEETSACALVTTV